MTERLIVKIVCGDCPSGQQRVMARLYDTPEGVWLRHNFKRPVHFLGEKLSTTDEGYDGPLHRTDRMSNGFMIGCRQHSRVGVTIDWLDGLVDRYRATGRPVTEVVHHSPL